MRLSKEAFSKARGFIMANARVLERSLFKFHFENGSAERVIEALLEYQNDDGGFGQALEPDIRMKDSSIVCTNIAFQIFREIRLPHDHELVRKGIRFLFTMFNEEMGLWPWNSAQMNEAPHAPWWHFDDADNPQRSRRAMINPGAEVAGYLNEYSEYIPTDFLVKRMNEVLEYLEEHWQKGSISGDGTYCCIRLLSTENLQSDHKKRLERTVRALIDRVITREESKWMNYCTKPLWLFPSPQVPFAEEFKEDIVKNLTYEIRNQGEDGSWSPFWSWGDYFPEVWLQAEKEWKGLLTLNILKSLRDYSRLDAAWYTVS